MLYELDHIVSDIKEVPESWIYKFYYKKLSKGNISINQPFNGRIIKVKSLISRDSNPSLCFFYKNRHYYWKDFSVGKGGSAVSFVSYHMNKVEASAINLIICDYEEYLMSTDEKDEIFLPDEIKRSEFKVKPDYYDVESLKVWERWKIDLPCLNKFKIRNGSYYTILKEDKEYTFNKSFFAFYNSKGPYQIYQPDNEVKYVNIDTNYLIGSEQLEFKSKFCGIISGLKDICAISMIGLNCEYIAGFSENSLISKDKIDFLNSKYEFVFSMLDDDEAGIRGMKLYEKAYGIPYVHIKGLKKDLALNNEHYSFEKLKYTYTDAIHKKINNT